MKKKTFCTLIVLLLIILSFAPQPIYAAASGKSSFPLTVFTSIEQAVSTTASSLFTMLSHLFIPHSQPAPKYNTSTIKTPSATPSVQLGTNPTYENAASFPQGQNMPLGSSVSPWLAVYLKNASIDQFGNMFLQGSGTMNGSLTVGNTLHVAGDTTLSDVTATGVISFPSLPTGILHATSSGTLISSAINLASSDVTGIVQPGNGGTGNSGTAQNGQLLIGNGTGYTLANINGTSHQVTINNSAGGITVSTPQNIDTTASPTFTGLTLSQATPYDLLYANGGSTLTSLPASTSGYVLQTNGTTAAPTWVPATSVGAAFSSLAGGTNTGAAMVVGNGSSLSYTGTGILNANQLSGETWAAPGAIGSTTANTGAFTSLSTSGLLSANGGLTLASGQNLSLSGFTPGSVPFINSSNQLAQDNSNFFWDSTNKRLGIGTTTPSDKLDILAGTTHVITSNWGCGNGYAGIGFTTTFTGCSNYALLGGDGNTYVNAPNSLLLETGSTHKIMVNGSGVGINTDTPTANLDVNGTASVSGQLALYGTPTIQSTANQTLVLGGNTTGDIQFKPGNSGSSLYLASNGNVGIGTTSATLGKLQLANGNIVLNSGYGIQVINTQGGLYSIPPLSFSNTGNGGFWMTANDGLLVTPAAAGSVGFAVRAVPGQTNDLEQWQNSSQTILSAINNVGEFGIGTTALNIGNAQLVVNQPNSSGDIFTASQAGNTKFVITNSGNVGIGTSLPNQTLEVSGNAKILAANASGGNNFTAPLLQIASLSNPFLSFEQINSNTGGIGVVGAEMTISTERDFGISTLGAGGSITAGTERLSIIRTGEVSIGNSNPLRNTGLSINATGANEALLVNQQGSGPLFTASSSGIALFKIDNVGNTRIGGSLCVKGTLSTPCSGSTSGTIYSSNTTVQSADVAENYVSSQTLEPGDLVIPANDGNNLAVVKTTGSYQQELIGVVSTNPGVTLNSEAKVDSVHKNVYPIALNGRVPVKVSMENGAISVGDYLTSSSVPGVAMKATKEGTIIGKALDTFDGSTGSTGKILVYVTVSWANPSIYLTADGNLSVNGQPVDSPLLPTTANALVANSDVPSLTAQNVTSGVTPGQFTSLAQSVSQLQSQIATFSAQVGKIDDFSKQLSELEKTVNLTQALQGTSGTQAVLGSSSASPQDSTIGGNLNVIGKTLLGDVGITGQVTQGLLTINGMDTTSGTTSATINTLSGPLKVQSLAVNGVDFLNGKVIIDTSGNIATIGDIKAKTIHADKYEATDSGSNASVGEATIPVGQTQVIVKTTAVTNRSSIFTSPDEPLEFSLGITHKQPGASFTVGIPKPTQQTIIFSWWIVN